MKFMCLVYFEPGAFDGATEAELTKLTDDTIIEDNELRRQGKLLLGQPLQGPETAVTVRGGKRGMSRTDGPFLETKEWLGGFTLVEARDMEEAIALTRDSAIMKYASVEIRPTLEQTHSETGQGRPEVKVSEAGAEVCRGVIPAKGGIQRPHRRSARLLDSRLRE